MNNNNSNSLRGTCTIKLGGKDFTLRFNNNTFRIIGERNKKNLSETMEMFSQEKMKEDALNSMNELIISAIINEQNYNGISEELNEKQMLAWIGDLDPEDIGKIMSSFGNAVSLKTAVPGN